MKAAKHNTGRLRRFIKWAGLGVTIALSAVWIGSGWYSMAYTNLRVGTVVVAYGALGCGGIVRFAPGEASGTLWTFRRITGYPGRLNWKPYHRISKTDGSHFLSIPLWMVVLVSGSVTAFAWRRDYLMCRKLKQGVCPHCAFNLSGLAPDAVCPECGKLRTPT